MLLPVLETVNELDTSGGGDSDVLGLSARQEKWLRRRELNRIEARLQRLEGEKHSESAPQHHS